MALSAAISVEMGLLKRNDYGRIISLLRSVDLPIWHEQMTRDLCNRALREAKGHRAGHVNLVIPIEIGSSTFVRSLEELDDRVLDAALAVLSSEFHSSHHQASAVTTQADGAENGYAQHYSI
jgi:3-dehydroquinate synthetase